MVATGHQRETDGSLAHGSQIIASLPTCQHVAARSADEPHNHGNDEEHGIDEKSVIASAKHGGISRNEAEQSSDE